MKTQFWQTFLLWLLFLTFSFEATSQQLLPCEADSLQLTRLELDQNGFVRLHLRTSGISDDLSFQEVMHTFAIGGEPISEIQPVQGDSVAFFLESLAGSHEFKVINTCSNESIQHFGATLYVNFTFEEDLNCPPVTNLVIDQFTNDFIAFSWADTSIHIEYQVGYQPGVAPELITSGIADPMFEQNLANAVVHHFTIIAFCDDPGPERDIVQSPPFRFSVITVDDIKLLPDRVDSAKQAIPIAFRMNAPCPPFQNTVNTDDFLNNLDDYILDPDSCMMVSAANQVDNYLKRVQLSPNPAQDELWISYMLPVAQNVSIDILSLSGQTINRLLNPQKHSSGFNQFKVQLPDSPNGLYLLRIKGEHFIHFERVIIGL